MNQNHSATKPAERNQNDDGRRTTEPPARRRRVWRTVFLVASVLVVLFILFVGAVLVFGRRISKQFSVAGEAMSGSYSTASYSMDGASCSMRSERVISGGDFISGGQHVSTSVRSDRRMQTPETPGTERYAEFRENGFRDTATEPLSTFSVDVDTASYTMARSSLMDLRRMPARDSVRVEEFVNYFDYGYPDPTGAVPFSVSCEMGACPWAPEHGLLKIGLQAKRIPPEDRPPNNLVFLIDISGSMGYPDRLPLLKQAFGLLVDGMRPDDYVSVVVYASGVRVHLEPTSGNDKERIRSALDALVASGGTSGGEGLRLAYDTARKNFRKGANNRILLATDGDFNVGFSNDAELVHFVETQRDGGIFLSVLGFGRGNYMDGRMKKIADNGNGHYAFIDSVLEAKKVLGTEAGSLVTVAKDVKIQIDFNPARVAAYRLVGYESRLLRAQDFKDDKKDAGEIGSGHSVTAFYELVPAGASAGVPDVEASKYTKTETTGSPESLTVRLRYKEPDSETSRAFEVPVVAEDVTGKDGPSEDFRFASAVAEFGLLLRDSPAKGTASYDDVIARARESRGRDENGYRSEFVRLAEAAKIYASQPTFSEPRPESLHQPIHGGEFHPQKAE